MTRPRRTVLALIEVGTNSCKFVIARQTIAADFRVVRFEKVTTRIGRGLSDKGTLFREGLSATRKAICGFLATVDADVPVFAFSTYALRRARDANTAITSLSHAAGVPLRIISGNEEARFAYLSASRTRVLRKRFTVIIDVGGGSTELIVAERSAAIRATSLPLGALHLTERFLVADPIDAEAFGQLRVHVERTIERAWRRLAPRTRWQPAQLDLIASGGSSTSLARMAKAVRGRHAGPSLRVDAWELRRLMAQCLRMPLVERRELPGLEPDRADIIPAGLAIVHTVAQQLRKRVLFVNPGGVREGAITHLFQNGLRW